MIGLALARYDLKPNNGVSWPANQIDYLIQPPAHDVLDRTAFSLTDADDQIRGAQVALLVGRACGDQSTDFGVLVINLKHGADAFERQTHVDVEVLGAPGREVIGVRIVLLCQRVRVDLKNVLGVVLIEPIQLILVTSLQGFRNVLNGFVGEYETQRLVFEPFPPALVKLLRVRRPRHGGIVDHHVLILLVIKARERVG